MNADIAYPFGSASRTTLATVLVVMLAADGMVAQEAGTGREPDTLTGRCIARMKLEETGVEPCVVLTSEAWGNVAGGLKTGTWFGQLLDLGVRLDTAKLGWWDGGNFFVQAHWVMHAGSSCCFDNFTGAFNPVSSIMAGDQFRVFNLHYRHAWGADSVVLKLGQIAADDDFMVSDYAGLFLNSAFGAMPSQVGTPLATSCGNATAFPIYSVAAPGLFLRVQPAASVYTQVGLYCGRPGQDESGNHGFDWVSERPAELGLFWEGGCSYRLGKLPATLRLGLSYHTGPLDDFSGATTGTPPATRQAVPNYYLIHDLQLLEDGEGHLKLGVFCRAGVTPEADKSMVSLYADAGLNWFAPLPGRADDVAGVAVSYTQFGRAFRNSTGPNGVAADETTLEFTYKAQVTRWLTMQADAQILFNPAVNPNSSSRETAVVVGLRAEAGF